MGHAREQKTAAHWTRVDPGIQVARGVALGHRASGWLFAPE
ncbi:MAG TPA: hypothetical protein VKT82_12190 [Ktedonobacterales bacterium]|nr:hypothetical protein [Ktedonobacterales bacterium]